MPMRNILIIAGALAVTGCASGSASSDAPRPSIATVSTAEAVTPAEVTVRAPPESELKDVIGEQADSLTSRFGEARIDLTEGDARKLQFAGSQCVLDIYLYPVAAGTQRVATHIEARLRQTGANTDQASCIAEIAGR